MGVSKVTLTVTGATGKELPLSV